MMAWGLWGLRIPLSLTKQTFTRQDQRKPMVVGPGPVTTLASLAGTPSPFWLSCSCHARLCAHQPKALLPQSLIKVNHNYFC